MPVPVCPDSYFQSAALKHIRMSHYFWPALTATGKSKHYGPVHPLHSIDCTGVFYIWVAPYFCSVHPLFSLFSSESILVLPGKALWFLPDMCISPLSRKAPLYSCLLSTLWLLSIINLILLILYISAWNGNTAFASRSESSPLGVEARTHKNLHTHVCLFMFACNRVTTQHCIQSFPEHRRNVYGHPWAEAAWFCGQSTREQWLEPLVSMSSTSNNSWNCPPLRK